MAPDAPRTTFVDSEVPSATVSRRACSSNGLPPPPPDVVDLTGMLNTTRTMTAVAKMANTLKGHI